MSIFSKKIEVNTGMYELDNRTVGRMLLVLNRYRSERGSFLFAGFLWEWRRYDDAIEVWIVDDVLLQSGTGIRRIS